MGYRVEYQSVKKIRGAEKRIARVASLTAMFFVIFLLLVTYYFPQGIQVIKELVCPDEAVAAAHALEAFAEELESGAKLTDALENLRQQAGLVDD